MNYAGYITKADLLSYIDSNDLQVLIGGSNPIAGVTLANGEDNIWQSLVAPSVEYAAGYVRPYYDATKEFRAVHTYDAAKAYVVGDRVINSEGVIFLCVNDAPIGTPLTDIAFFEQRDDRNASLVEIVCSILLYFLFRRVSPMNIPEIRVLSYDAAKETLRDIQRARIDLNIAKREDVATDDAGQTFAWGEFDPPLSNSIY